MCSRIEKLDEYRLGQTNKTSLKHQDPAHPEADEQENQSPAINSKTSSYNPKLTNVVRTEALRPNEEE